MQGKTRKKDREDPVKPAKERVNIRCRHCFMVDGYAKGEEDCKHCGHKMFRVDRV